MSISLDQLSNVLYSLFLLYAKNEDYQNILKLSCGPLFFTSYNAFLKKLRCLELASLLIFSWFLKKNISHFIFYYQTKFHCLMVFASWDIEQYVHCNCFFYQVVTPWILKPTLSFWSSRFSTRPKSQDKNLNILTTKRVFKVK